MNLCRQLQRLAKGPVSVASNLDEETHAGSSTTSLDILPQSINSSLPFQPMRREKPASSLRCTSRSTLRLWAGFHRILDANVLGKHQDARWQNYFDPHMRPRLEVVRRIDLIEYDPLPFF